MSPEHSVVLSLQLADPHTPAVVVMDGRVVDPRDARSRVDAENLIYAAATGNTERGAFVVRELRVLEQDNVDGPRAHLSIAAVVAASTPEPVLRHNLGLACVVGRVAVDESDVSLLATDVAQEPGLKPSRAMRHVLVRFWTWLCSLLRRSR